MTFLIFKELDFLYFDTEQEFPKTVAYAVQKSIVIVSKLPIFKVQKQMLMFIY